MQSGLGLGLTPPPIACRGSDTQSSETRAVGDGCLHVKTWPAWWGLDSHLEGDRGTQSPACPGGQWAAQSCRTVTTQLLEAT